MLLLFGFLMWTQIRVNCPESQQSEGFLSRFAPLVCPTSSHCFSYLSHTTSDVLLLVTRGFCRWVGVQCRQLLLLSMSRSGMHKE